MQRYTNGHLFPIYGERNSLMEEIARKLGHLSDEDFANLDLFNERIRKLTQRADTRNCQLYVDAEQTFIQAAIESFGQQMTHQYNRDEKVIIMNGYQCYLKRMANTIPMEVKASQAYGYNLGIKLIRGAYMNEERELAAKEGLESPVWDTIEDTHNCYNENLRLLLTQMKHEDMVFVASHNKDTCDIAMDLADERGFKETERVRFGQLRGFSD